jgi:predicted transcriptional regulator
MPEQSESSGVHALTTKIVVSHVANNTVVAGDLPKLIQQVFDALSNISSGVASPARPRPAVPVKRSVTPDYIVCLEDGKKLKMLKRHLMTSYGLTPDEYRERWGLAADYPMVAPNYAAQRSALAKKIGLGTKPRKRRRAA